MEELWEKKSCCAAQDRGGHELLSCVATVHLRSSGEKYLRVGQGQGCLPSPAEHAGPQALDGGTEHCQAAGAPCHTS